MPYIRILAISLASTSLMALPAQAGGLLRGIGANCLCNASNTAHSGTGNASRAHNRGIGLGALRGRNGTSFSRRGTNAGGLSASVTGMVVDSTSRTTSRRHGMSTGAPGLAGTVYSSSGVANVVAFSRNGASGRALANVSAANGRGGPAGKVVNVSALNRSGTTDRSLANVAALNGRGGMAGRIVNVSVLNRTGTSGRSLANVAVLNGRGSTAGKIVNLSALNRTGTNGKSLANVAVVNGSAGSNGRLANVAVLNGHRGNGRGGLVLPRGVRIINGIPCGPDGVPLTGAAAIKVMAVIGTKGSHGAGNPGGSNSTPPGGSTNVPRSDSPAGNGHPRNRDMADRKDLWWPPHYQGYDPDGRLNDH